MRGATGRAVKPLLRVQVRSLDVPKESEVPQHGLACSVTLQPVRVLVAIPLLLRTQRWLNTWLGGLQQQAAAAAEAAAAAASAAAAEAAEATARAVRAAANEPTPIRLHVRLRGPLLVLPAARGATVVRVGTLELRNSILSGPDAVIEPAGGGHGARWRERTSGAIDRIHLSLTHTGIALVPRAAEAFDAAWMLRPGFAPHWLLDENLQLSLTLDRVLKQGAAAAGREAEQGAQARLAHYRGLLRVPYISEAAGARNQAASHAAILCTQAQLAHYEKLLEKLAELQRANPDDGSVQEQVALTEGLVRDARQAVSTTRRTGEAGGAAEGDEDGGEGGEGMGASQPAVMKLRLKLSLVQAEAAYSEACYAIDAAAELLLLRPPSEPSTLASRQASSSTPDGRTKTARSQSIASATADSAAIAPVTAANTPPAAAASNTMGGVALSVLVEVACEDGISLRLLDDSTGARLASLTPAPP